MKTPVSSLLLLVLLVFAADQATLSWAEKPAPSMPPTAEPAALSVTKFEGTMPVGYLGVPLGTVVRVTGVAIDGDTTRRKADAGKTLLLIEVVNDKKLPRPILFEFLRAAREVRKPAAGVRFDYYVHEYGHFDGVVEPPKELGINTLPVANDGFYYRRYVTVHASNPVRK